MQSTPRALSREMPIVLSVSVWLCQALCAVLSVVRRALCRVRARVCVKTSRSRDAGRVVCLIACQQAQAPSLSQSTVYRLRLCVAQ